MSRNSHSIAPIFGENIGRFSKLKIIGLDQALLKSGKTIASLNSGDLFGEMSFMSKDPASADAVAAEVVKYAYWTHDDLDKLCQRNCNVYNKFISIIGNDLVRKLNVKNAELLSKLS